MKVAVVGAGFSGLALSWYLLSKGYQVDLYDEKGVGAGASGIASGLLHPYVGEQVRRSWKALEAMDETKKLLEIAQGFSKTPVFEMSGIQRRVTPKQAQTFLKHASDYQDVEILSEDLVKITSGMTVHSSDYLLGLYKACLEKGLRLILKKIHSTCELQEYDAFIIAIGSGIFSFLELKHLVLSKVRGQTLLCKWPFPPLKSALLGKGHIVPLKEKDLVYLGATYERGIEEDFPCMETALENLIPQAEVLFPDWTEIHAIECKSAFRVVRPAHAVPWIYPMGEKGLALTAMGSRGLLYHAYFAEMLVEMLPIL